MIEGPDRRPARLIPSHRGTAAAALRNGGAVAGARLGNRRGVAVRVLRHARAAVGTALQDRRHIARSGLQHVSDQRRSEEHTSELQSLMRISYAVFCLKKKKKYIQQSSTPHRYKEREYKQ